MDTAKMIRKDNSLIENFTNIIDKNGKRFGGNYNEYRDRDFNI
jgi:hypothetical protein